jgi:Pentapeptide repeats (8 copies)
MVEKAQDVASSLESLSDSGRKEIKDKRVLADVSQVKWRNLLFVRLVAKGGRFVGVDFSYCIFDACYLRNSSFDECDFTGCRFVSCNLHGAKFSGCKFGYATFERTLVDDSILDVGCPVEDNLRMRFARTLRMNYQQIGDAASANKAVKTELEATGTHLYKAWNSNESYHRRKYAGIDRAAMFVKWTVFKALDMIWGNGESLWKLCRFIGVILLLILALDATTQPIAKSAWENVQRALQIFFGITAPKEIPEILLTLIVFIRLVTFGFFMAILIKRFNRR